jgi:hypothetical protein
MYWRIGMHPPRLRKPRPSGAGYTADEQAASGPE